MKTFLAHIFIGLVAILGFSSLGYAQTTITFTDGGSVSMPCGNPNTFLDGFGGAYSSNLSDTMTICSDGINGFAVALVFAQEVAGYWDVDETDTLYIYDGNDTQAPLIGAYNNGNLQFGTLSVVSSEANQSGCLTLVFVSDGADEAQGFSGTATCFYPCQPIEPYITSTPQIFPSDSSGTIDVCLGDTVWLTANANFPLSGSGNGAYNQTLANSNLEWLIAGGYQVTGTSGYFVPTQNAGFYVDLVITDTLGCLEYARTKVRVSTVPSYIEMATVLDDTICPGESTIILGGLNSILQDTTGVEPTTGEFIIGGLFSDPEPLYDGATGTPQDLYTTPITISGANPTDTISSGEQVINVCIEMEHSWLTDLEAWLTCPNGTTVPLFNAYNETFGANLPGYLPGGFPASSGINLGIPGPGIGDGTCWSYCFSGTQNTFGSFEDEYQGMTTQMTSGTYLPEESYDALIGCPINGTWSINIADNWGGDDGYICQWSIELADSLTPEPEFYTPQIVSGVWTPDPSITNLGDTAIEVLPPGAGNHSYTFTIEDNFGCNHDTTVTIHVVPPLADFVNDTAVCSETFSLSAADYDIIGEWTYNGPLGGNATFTPNQFAHQPLVEIDGYGDYEFIYESSFCGQSDTIVVDFNPTPSPVALANQTICPGTNLVFDAANEDIGATYLWAPSGATGQVLEMDSVLNSGGIQVTVTNDCGTANGAATITVHTLTVTGPLEVCLVDEANLSATSTTTGGNWTYTGPDGATAAFSPNQQDATPSVSVDMPGEYQFVFTDDVCAMQKTWDVTFTQAPAIEISMDTNRICLEGEITLSYQINTETYDNLQWDQYTSNTTDTLVLLGTDSITYSAFDSLFYVTATITNFCGTATDEVAYQVVDCTLDVPNVFNPNSSVPENAYFNLVSLGLHPGNNVKIFDRWGRKCYDVDNYHLNPWDGAKESDGVYFWMLERPGYEAESGYVHLVR